MKKFLVVVVCFLAIGCSNDIRDIPAGYVGKVLTSSGWQKEILEAGQIDIKTVNSDGSYNTLVLLEATSTTVKENFGKAVGEGEDHRILIGKTPVTVDMYVRAMVPADKDERNAIFAQITPKDNGNRVKTITVEMIYEQFARMDVRGGVREVMSKYSNVQDVLTKLDTTNSRIAAMVIKTFKNNGVPLLVQNTQLSNVKMDETVWAAENQKAASLAQIETIDKIGEALRRNPEYLQFKRYDTYKEIAAKGGTSFTIIDGQPNGVVIK